MDRRGMTERERLEAALNYREADRVPLVLASREFSIHHAGLRFGDVWSDPSRYVAAQAKVVRDFQLDAAWDLWCTPAVDEALGAPMELPEDDAPWMPTPGLRRKEDIRKLDVRVDPERHGRMPFLLAIVKGLKAAVGPQVPVIAWVSPPFRTACMLRGTDNLYLDLVEDPAFAKELIELVSGPCTAYGKALVEAGADVIATSNPVANQDCISREHYREFSHPFTKRMFAALKAHGDVKVLYHTCGKWDDRFDLVTDEHVDILHVDKVDVGPFKQRWGDRITVMGNVRSVESMLQGTPERVRGEATACIDAGAAGGGFILSADCTLPRETPETNVAAIVETARSHGVYR